MGEQQAAISETELAVLKVLWERPSATVRELLDALRDQGRRWAYTTVQTLLYRLEAKGYVVSAKALPAHQFRATVTREQLLQRRLTDLADQLCGGTASPLVLALVEGGQFSRAELDQLRQLLDQLDSGPAPSPPDTD